MGVALGLFCVLAPARADQLRLDALIQEGELILDEAAALTPAADQLAAEGRRLLDSENALRSEVQSLNQSITQFNAAMGEYSAEVQALRTKCAAQRADKALQEACDTRTEQLHERANLLEEERAELHLRQEELNARVDGQNTWGRDYAKRKHAHDTNDKLNQRDSEDWLARAQQFLASEDFAAFLVQAGNPVACSASELGEPEQLSGRPGLERAEACFKALKLDRR